MEKLISYFKETKAEMKHVSWPTKEQTLAFTVLVIAISVVSGLLLGLFDGIFERGLQALLLK